MLEAPLSSNDTKATHVDNLMRRGFAHHPFKLSGPSSLNALSKYTPSCVTRLTSTLHLPLPGLFTTEDQVHRSWSNTNSVLP